MNAGASQKKGDSVCYSYRLILAEEKTTGIKAVACDKLPLAGEGGVWFGERWQGNWDLSELSGQR